MNGHNDLRPIRDIDTAPRTRLSWHRITSSVNASRGRAAANELLPAGDRSAARVMLLNVRHHNDDSAIVTET
jgi:hypothetical protein